MKVIGITGGTGSGKSTVTEILRCLGVEVIDADNLAREVVKKGERALEEVVQHFGKDVLLESGELNRPKLREIVFSNSNELKILNKMMHKYIEEKIRYNIQCISTEGKTDVIVIDAPIPLKKGFVDVSDEIWVVVAKPETRIARIMKRSKLTKEEAEKVLHSQMNQKEYCKLANQIIENNSSIEELKEKVLVLFQRVSHRGSL